MAFYKVISCILHIFRLPIVVAEFVLTAIRLLFASLHRGVIKIDFWLEWQASRFRFGLKEYTEPSKSNCDVNSMEEHLPGTEAILASLKGLMWIDVNSIRKAFEKHTEAGQKVLSVKRGRLYAVLRPTRQENLQRIKNVLEAMTEQEKKSMQRRLESLVTIYHAKHL